MNKKNFIPTFIIVVFFFLIFVAILQYRSQRSTFLETVPLLITRSTATPSINDPHVFIKTQRLGIPKQTQIEAITKSGDIKIAIIEKNKIVDMLPIRVEDFSTWVNLKTTINIYSLSQDPMSVLRIEIYGINFNIPNLTGPNAVAFKESFLEAKRQLVSRGINMKNLLILYGNRQYIQDTASYWVKISSLLD